MDESLFEEIKKLCVNNLDDTYNQINQIMHIKDHTNEHQIIQAINKHIARVINVDPPLELPELPTTDQSFSESVDLLTRAVVAEARLAERDDEFHRMQGRMRDLQHALTSLTSENAKLNEQLTAAPIISPVIRSQRPSLTAALSSIESRHAQQIADLEHKHAQELEHTLQYKYLFAQLASRKEDLELALELEKQKTRKTRTLIEKCIKVTEQFETQEQRLAGTVARLAHQLIEAGISIKVPVASTQPFVSDSDSTTGIEVFSEADRSLMAELFAPSVRVTPTVRSPAVTPPLTPRIPSLPVLPAYVNTNPSSMTHMHVGTDLSSSSALQLPPNNRPSYNPSSSSVNQTTAKWMQWPKWSRKGGPQAHV